MRTFGKDRKWDDSVIRLDGYRFRTVDRQFVCYLHFTSFAHLSLGFHLDLSSPNVEIHLPFCFIQIGWQGMSIPVDMEYTH